MPEVTNNTRQSVSFVTGKRKGEPVVEELLPGATRDIAIDEGSASVRGLVSTSAITVDGARRAGRAPVPATPAKA